MKRLETLFLLTALIACSAFAAASTVAARSVKRDGGDKQPVTNKKCPVSGDEVDPKLRVEYQGQYVYFCCDGCPQQFQANPTKYIAKMSKEDQEAIKPNEKCPITGSIVDKNMWVETEGRKVYFCCPTCLAQFKKTHKVTAASDEPASK